MKRLLIFTGDVAAGKSTFAKLEKPLILEANFHKRELQQLQNIVECARKEGTVGTVIKICADDFSYRTDEELLQKIDCFMKEPAR